MFKKIYKSIKFHIKNQYTWFKFNQFNKRFANCGLKVKVFQPVCLQGQEYISVGDYTTIGTFSHMWGQGGITIGKRVMIASNCSITTITHDHSQANMYETIVKKPIVIEDDVWIGANAVIMPGVTLGKGCVIGAGSVVTKDVPDMAIHIGVPAKFLKMREIYTVV